MKLKFVSFLLISLLATTVWGQDKMPADNCCCGMTEQTVSGVSDISATFDHPQIQQSVYWKRHKLFKTLGWTSLLAGVGGVGYGLFSDMSQDKAIGALIGGGCLVLASVPMFGLARSNKQKARSLSLQGRSLVSPLPNGSVSYRPGLSLCLNF